MYGDKEENQVFSCSFRCSFLSCPVMCIGSLISECTFFMSHGVLYMGLPVQAIVMFNRVYFLRV